MKNIEKREIVFPKNLSRILSAEETTEEKYNDIYSRVETLLDITEQLQNIQSKIGVTDQLLANLYKEENTLMEQLDVCPYCGSKLTTSTKKRLLEKQENEYRKDKSWR